MTISDLTGWLRWYRHNQWWAKWTCPTCLKWAWTDLRQGCA